MATQRKASKPRVVGPYEAATPPEEVGPPLEIGGKYIQPIESPAVEPRGRYIQPFEKPNLERGGRYVQPFNMPNGEQRGRYIQPLDLIPSQETLRKMEEEERLKELRDESGKAAEASRRASMGTTNKAKGGMVGSASKRADGIAQRGKTQGKFV